VKHKPALHSHPWWQHVADRHRPIARRRAAVGRLRLAARRRSNQLLLLAALYGLLCLIPVLFGGSAISVLALVPVLVLPALGVLTWWLMWKEFHH
jgi:hypothetical protein